ncbi:hypothetical protein BOO86_00890 [Mycobacterium sp. CBMA 234]|nr:hypothetical protein [Mycolicibacterium sp. CBMA 234]
MKIERSSSDHLSFSHAKHGLQRKLAVGATNDALEREADRTADYVMRTPDRLVQRTCDGCAKDEEELRPKRVDHANSEVSPAPAIVDRTLATAGDPLDSSARAFMEPRFRADFSRVRVHTDALAHESSRAVNASAYTVGRHIVFSPGRYAPHSADGRSLLAHELAHVVQQGGNAGRIQRVPEKLGTSVVEPTGTAPPFKKASATFDGATFVLTGDSKVVVSAAGQSGHPNTVDPADVAACKGSPGDSYLNNSRYVGIKDKGPIPEGVYTFNHSDMTTFSWNEQRKMSLAKPGEYVDPKGLDLHGDWGAGRVALKPVKILPSKFCGNTASRSGFYLHGGSMPGSSGCIDIGNSAITEVVNKLMGYTTPVPVTVKYTAAPPSVGILDRAAGRFMYPKNKDAGFWGRVGGIFGD